VIETAEKILDLEPYDRTTVSGGATVTFNWLIGAVQAVVPGLPPHCRRADIDLGVGRYNFLGDRRKASESQNDEAGSTHAAAV
jgi:hypothetical protein